MNKLNLGCSTDYRPGWVNVDCLKTFRADIYHDLNKYPYPFNSNKFDEVLMSMILEHLDNPVKALKEVVRICNDGAKLTIIVPHANTYSNKTNIMHTRDFTENSFCDELLLEYDLNELVLMERKFLYPVNRWKQLIPFKWFFKIFFNGIYDDLSFVFRVVKK